MDPAEAASALRYRCNLCGKSYKSKVTLNRHHNSHDENVQYDCQFCDAIFQRKDLLSRHIRIHLTVNGADTMPDRIRSRQRTSAACANCRRHKIKCTGGFPCSFCSKRGNPCINHRRAAQAVGARIDQNRGQTLTSLESPNGDLSDTLPSTAVPAPDDSGVDDRSRPLESISDSTFQRISDLPVDLPSLSDPFGTTADEVARLQQLAMFDFPLYPNNPSWLYENNFPSLAVGDEASILSTFDLPTDASFPYYPENQYNESVSANTGLTAPPTSLSSQIQHYNPRTSEAVYESPLPGHVATPNTSTSAQSSIDDIQREVIEGHIIYAVEAGVDHESPENTAERVHARHAGSRKAETAFGLDSLRSAPHDSRDALDRFVALYFEKFHSLCPIFWEQGFDSYKVSPIVFLTIVSIGSMFAGEKAAHYGAMLRGRLRTLFLTTALSVSNKYSRDYVLLVSGVLMATAEIFLGDQDSLPGAQQMSCTLVSLARRLFTTDPYDSHIRQQRPNVRHHGERNNEMTDWIESEERKRLAFGIFRIEAYMSAIYGSKPLLSFEEMKIPLPCPDYLWTAVGHDSRRRLEKAIEQTRQQDHFTFADLAYDLVEQAQPKPLLAGRDHSVFVFQEIFWRLFNYTQPIDLAQMKTPESQSFRITSLQQDHEKAISILRTWDYRQEMESHQISSKDEIHFHWLYLRLHAPIRLLERTLSSIEDTNSVVQEAVRVKISDWMVSDQIKVALEHAFKLYELVRFESASTEEIRTRFDFTILCAIYHAALVMWAFTGACEREEVNMEIAANGHALSPELVNAVLPEFVALYTKIVPSWFSQPFFRDKLAQLIEQQFPILSQVA